MATLTKNDELNNIESFFEPMELSDEEKEKRVNMAYDLYAMLNRFFVILGASITLNKVDRDYLIDYLKRGYDDILLSFGLDVSDNYYDYYIDLIANSILETTEQNKANALSESRAREIAVNDVNALENHSNYEEKVVNGYKTKRWVTMNDEKVRFNHVMADGQEVPIDEPFTVGSSKMLYPMDVSLGATADEIINCRCTCIYYK